MRLHRTLVIGRLLGGGAHPLLLAFASACAVLGALMLGGGQSSPVLGCVLLAGAVGSGAGWLRGFTAWAEFDDDGVRWRYWVRHAYPWPQIARIDLSEQHRLTSASEFPVIVVQWRASGEQPADSDDIRPARGCGRHRREFGAALLEAAARHGVRTRVRSTGWDLPVSDPDPAGWS